LEEGQLLPWQKENGQYDNDLQNTTHDT